MKAFYFVHDEFRADRNGKHFTEVDRIEAEDLETAMAIFWRKWPSKSSRLLMVVVHHSTGRTEPGEILLNPAVQTTFF